MAIFPHVEPALSQTPSTALERSAASVMREETRARRGRVGRVLAGQPVAPGTWAIAKGEFLLRTGDGFGLHYRRGEGVTIDEPPGADPRDTRLWVEGTLYAAIAALNDLVPLHASAVAYGSRVFAFTGPAGAGKSTLAAALERVGFAPFCDDTLILDPGGLGPPLCLPGHKRMKLWPAGAQLANTPLGERVAGDYAKHFAAPVAPHPQDPLPLAALIVLASADVPGFAPLALGQRIAVLDDDHYTGELWRRAGRRDRASRFAELAALAERFEIARFERPFDPARFAAGVAAAAAYIRSAP